MPEKYRIGLLGGTFNPIHEGHIELAKSVLEKKLVDRVDVIPVYFAAHKNNAELLPYKERCNLVKRAFFSEQNIYLSKVESFLPTPSYTIRTLQYYGKEFPNAQVFLLMGSSDFISVPQWYCGTEVLQSTNIIVVPRRYVTLNNVFNTIKKYHKIINIMYNPKQKTTIITTKNLKEYIYVHKRKLAISSTIIRERKNALFK